MGEMPGGGVAGGEDGDEEAFAERGVEDGTEGGLGVDAVAVEVFHDAADFVHAEVAGGGEADEDGGGFGEDLAVLEERVRGEFFHDLAGAVGAGGFDGGEGALGVAPAEDGAEVGEIELEQMVAVEQPPDAGDGLAEQVVGEREALR